LLPTTEHCTFTFLINLKQRSTKELQYRKPRALPTFYKIKKNTVYTYNTAPASILKAEFEKTATLI